MTGNTVIPNLTGHPGLDRLLKESVAAFNALTPEQQEAHRKVQAESWVRGEMGLASDKRRARTGDMGDERAVCWMCAEGAMKDANEIERLLWLLNRWCNVPEVTEIDAEDRDPDTETLWRETRRALRLGDKEPVR
jgi:hypothetical protein